MSSCDNCGKSFKYPYLLLRHLERKTPCLSVDKKKGCVKVKVRYECDICKKIFSCRQSKYEHKKNVICSPPEDKVENAKYECNVCKKVFTHRQNLHRHKNNVKCSPPKDSQVEELKQELRDLKEQINNSIKITNNSTSDNKVNGIIYLLLEREFIKTGENVYKVGKTSNINKRMSKYPKGSFLYFSVVSDDIDRDEKEILSVFENEFIQRRDIGSEYFEGDNKLMIKQIFLKLSENFDTVS